MLGSSLQIKWVPQFVKVLEESPGFFVYKIEWSACGKGLIYALWMLFLLHCFVLFLLECLWFIFSRAWKKYLHIKKSYGKNLMDDPISFLMYMFGYLFYCSVTHYFLDTFSFMFLLYLQFDFTYCLYYIPLPVLCKSDQTWCLSHLKTYVLIYCL